ncbi:MAG TPA: RIP metalloprotease RseP [Acetobacteraceae bacterium]|nr:RIP metalloprotease RseP [Acetobacteraceae bacterium]
MIDLLRTIVSFLVVLGILISVHEFGHYLAARFCGVHVEAFSIGFGRSLATWRDRQGTEWRLAALPLGGYVRLHGQEPLETVTAEERARWIPGRAFQEKPVGARAIVVAAGPCANFVLAVVLFALLFATAGRPVVMPVVDTVVPGGAAAAAGLHPGDHIVAIGTTKVRSFADIQRLIEAEPDRNVTLSVVRGGHTISLPVHTGEARVAGTERGVLGISGDTAAFQRLAPGAAIAAAVSESVSVGGATLNGVWQIVTTRHGSAELGGPLRIAELSGQVAALGVVSFVSFIAVLSINLGLLNLLPIPILDGGHLLFFLAEALHGRPLSARAQEIGLRAGLALLVCVFVFATWNDLAHLGMVRWMKSL